ncbi:MSHA biogenesis protein MshD [Sesbania bispinosa]|nr:MSHA biogenesis protein MshD [Sesbania bispinosa]
MTVYNQSGPRYGPNLGVPQARSLAAIVTENARRISKKKEGETSGIPEETHSGPTSTDTRNGQKSALAETEVVEAIPATNDQLGKSCSPSRGDEIPLSVMGPTANQPHPNSSDRALRQAISPLQKINAEVELPHVDDKRSLKKKEVTVESSAQNSRDDPSPVQTGPIYLNAHDATRSNAPVTRLDLNSSQVSPGLRPQDPNLLAIQPECIGLKNPIIITDYPSPQKNGTSLFGYSLTAEESGKCKSFWFLESGTQASRSSTDARRKLRQEAPKISPPQDYCVEFLLK